MLLLNSHLISVHVYVVRVLGVFWVCFGCVLGVFWVCFGCINGVLSVFFAVFMVHLAELIKGVRLRILRVCLGV